MRPFDIDMDSPKTCADFIDPVKEQDRLRKMKELRLLRRAGTTPGYTTSPRNDSSYQIREKGFDFLHGNHRN